MKNGKYVLAQSHIEEIQENWLNQYHLFKPSITRPSKKEGKKHGCDYAQGTNHLIMMVHSKYDDYCSRVYFQGEGGL